jgi:hypothetical protein
VPNAPPDREYHLDYEIWMLEQTYTRLRDDEVIKNAIIESFCVHARNLLEFFWKEAPKYTQNYVPFSQISAKKRTNICQSAPFSPSASPRRQGRAQPQYRARSAPQIYLCRLAIDFPDGYFMRL